MHLGTGYLGFYCRHCFILEEGRKENLQIGIIPTLLCGQKALSVNGLFYSVQISFQKKNIQKFTRLLTITLLLTL